ncbi:DUF305 domain-containing protein [Agromyces sp. CFH 90414]|uniref:DUF305 domain-containing protein n=1 Tax=Agromyces agglutinans TaxID=2662258 RepID=A0A6I2F288_9MICO|nr:DUF305 domain-containing protein [Agromyces agglutinans]MRG58709.1 DUF305 domain-containing protein [Agromyces agglutinans]
MSRRAGRTTGRAGRAGRAALAPTVAIALTLAIPVGTTACAGPPSAVEASAPDSAIDAATSADDLAWVAGMAAHHDQAVALAGLAAERAGDPRVAAAADRIAVAQSAEASVLRGWLDRRGAAEAGHGHGDGGDPAVAEAPEGMPGEIAASAMRRAAELEGAAFDRVFVDLMIRHHEGAIEMSEARLEASGDPAVARWARTVAQSQSIEIDRLRELAAGGAG